MCIPWENVHRTFVNSSHFWGGEETEVDVYSWQYQGPARGALSLSFLVVGSKCLFFVTLGFEVTSLPSGYLPLLTRHPQSWTIHNGPTLLENLGRHPLARSVVKPLPTECANCKCSYLVIKANLAGLVLGSPWLAISSVLLYWLGSHKNVSL